MIGKPGKLLYLCYCRTNWFAKASHNNAKKLVDEDHFRLIIIDRTEQDLQILK